MQAKIKNSSWGSFKKSNAQVNFVSFMLGRELFTPEKAMVPCVHLSTNCGLDNLITVQILFLLYYKPILQLVDDCTYGTIAFPCMYRQSPVKSPDIKTL